MNDAELITTLIAAAITATSAVGTVLTVFRERSAELLRRRSEKRRARKKE